MHIPLLPVRKEAADQSREAGEDTDHAGDQEAAEEGEAPQETQTPVPDTVPGECRNNRVQQDHAIY